MSFFGVFWFFWGVGVVRFFSKFRIQSRMILVNTVPNPNLLTQSVGKISHRENPCLFFLLFFVFFWGLGWSDFFSKVRIQSRMIIVNTVPNPNLLTQSIGKLSHRENPCLFWGFFGFFWGLGWSNFFQNFGSKAE